MAADADFAGKVLFLLIGVNTPREEAQKYVRNHSVVSSILHGTDEATEGDIFRKVYGVDSVPHQIVVGQDGIVLVNGPPKSIDAMKRILKSHISEMPKPNTTDMSAQITPEGAASISPVEIMMSGMATVPNNTYEVKMTLQATKKTKIGRHNVTPQSMHS